MRLDGVPGEIVVRDRKRKASVGVLLVLELAVDDLAEEGSVREMGPRDERLMGNVGRGGVSPRPLVAVNELCPVRKEVLTEDEPFFPTGTVLSDVAWVNANLGLKEWGGSGVVGRETSGLAGTVVVHGGL